MRTYTDDVKARVLADFALGSSKSALAKKYGIPRTTVIDWVSDTAPPVPTVTDTSQREHLGQLVYDYLVTGFEALIAQNRIAADRAYLERDGTSIVSVYNAIHAGVVAVAQAVERGIELNNEADGSLDASPDSEGPSQPG